MSSTDSSSTEAGGGALEHPPAPGSRRTPPKSSLPTAIITLLLLGLLVWGLNPRRPKLQPAPLQPPRAGCAPGAADFVPSNLTDVPGMSLGGLAEGARNRALLRLNMEPCSCGCKQSLALCRAGNPQCRVSPGAADAIVKEESAEPGCEPGGGRSAACSQSPK